MLYEVRCLLPLVAGTEDGAERSFYWSSNATRVQPSKRVVPGLLLKAAHNNKLKKFLLLV